MPAYLQYHSFTMLCAYPAHFQTTSRGDKYTKMAFKRSVSYVN